MQRLWCACVGLAVILSTAPAWADVFDDVMLGERGDLTSLTGTLVLTTPLGTESPEVVSAENLCIKQFPGTLDIEVDLGQLGLGDAPFPLRLSGERNGTDAIVWKVDRAFDQCITILRDGQEKELTVRRVSGELSASLHPFSYPRRGVCAPDHAVGFDGRSTGEAAGNRLRVEMKVGCGGTPVLNVSADFSDVRILGQLGRHTVIPDVSLASIGFSSGAVCGGRPQSVGGVVALNGGAWTGGFSLNLGLAVYPGDASGDERPTLRQDGFRIPFQRNSARFTVDIPADFVGHIDAVAIGEDESVVMSELLEVIHPAERLCPWMARLHDVVRFERVLGGCHVCRLGKVNRWLEPRIINARVRMDNHHRLANAFIGRNAVGLSAAWSETPEGFPVSTLELGGITLAEFEGVRLFDLNDRGMAVGEQVVGEGTRAVLFDGKELRDLGTFGGKHAAALALGADGLAIGWAEDGSGARRAFVSKEGELLQIALPDHLESRAISISGERWIAGDLVDKDGHQRGFLFDLETQKVELLQPTKGFAHATVADVNGQGIVVGTLHQGDPQEKGSTGFIYSGEKGLMPISWVMEVDNVHVDRALSIAADGTVFAEGAIDGRAETFFLKGAR